MLPFLLIPPFQTYEVVEPLLDSMWHYECVVSPKQLKTSISFLHYPPSTPSISSSPSLSSLPSQEEQWLQKVFQTFDEDEDGRLTHTELLRSMEKMGIPMAPNIVERLLSSVSTKEKDHIDVQEFILLYESTSSVTKGMHEEDESELEEEDEDLKEAFKLFDRNGDGYICAEELQRVLSKMGLLMGEVGSECERMIRRVDEDGNGMIDFAEFKKMMCTSQLRVSCC